MKDMKNLFCHKSDLTNESSVEKFFVDRLLTFLHYPDKFIKPKKSLKEIKVSKGSKPENYKPDYVCLHDKKPKIVIDAKSTKENPDDYNYQVSGYSLGLNRKFKGENPVRYTILTNGIHFKLYNWDEEDPIISMTFEDFVQSNPKLKKLIDLIDYKNIKSQTGKDEILIEDFLKKTSVEDLKLAFKKCHNLIWRRQKISPTDAFYEFSKIIFVKLNEDKRLRKILNERGNLKRTDFKFSINWLEDREDETENPLSSILFKELIKKLNENTSKKPIFLDDFIDLKTDTIKEVVRILQNKDFYKIDEDLNGRMFEEFLNATIRGKELGQYFTPRKIVEFMVKLANPKIKYNSETDKYYIDTVLDGCCGSGGFLIDVMADLIEKSKRDNLKSYKDELIKDIRTKSLLGIEANPKVSRIARMNMHIHEDGGSRIYCADALDKDISITKGENDLVKKDLIELREILVNDGKKFDIVLTNPPFSMVYKKSEKDQRKILNEYASDNEKENLTYEKGTKKLKPSIKSNVLFVARYAGLLNEGGKLFIILDNSVLNSYSHAEYRDYIRNNFIIKAIFSLPTHTFVNQQAGGITSILYLEKRKSENQEQEPIYARVIHNVGHSTSGKELSYDDFDDTLKEYRKYQKEGKLYLKGGQEIGNYENDDLFLIDTSKIDDRIDVFFYQPSYHKLIEKLKLKEKEGLCELKNINDFNKVETIDEKLKAEKKEDENSKDEEDTNIYKYVEISSIDKERGFFIHGDWEEGLRFELSPRAKLYIKENDVLFSKPYRSLKKVAIVPKEINGSLASSGFYGIRPKDYLQACLIWSIFRSELIQKQLVHISSGYTQRELSDEYIKKYLIIPLPKKDSDKIANIVKNNIALAIQSRKAELEALGNITGTPEKSILGEDDT